MIIRPLLEMPLEIAGKLAKGSLQRTGGVIRDANTGQIVQHLREASPLPQCLNEGAPAIQSLLGFGSVVSTLNLGATLAFGATTLLKLKQMESKLDAMDRKLTKMDLKLDNLQWAIDRVYEVSQSIWNEVVGIRILIEDGIQADLVVASRLAGKAQAREPGDHQRDHLFTEAQGKAAHAVERLRIKTHREMASVTDQLRKRTINSKYRDIGHGTLEDMIRTLKGYRMTLKALSMKSLIGADAGFLQQEILEMKSDADQLGESLKLIGQAFFCPEMFSTYDFFLNRFFGVEMQDPARKITISRLVRLLSKIDKRICSADALIEVMQEQSAPDYHRLNECTEGWDSWMRPMPEAFHEIESAFEDYDRVQGHLAELRFCSEHGMAIQEYRQKLEVNELPEDGKIVYFQALG